MQISEHHIDNVPYINQKAIGMPNGCESVSTVMALQKIGIDISPDTFVDRYLSMGSIPYWKNGVRYGFDPNKEFGGNPRRADGWGCFAPVIMKALNKFSDSCGFTATNVSGTSLSALCSNYIDKDIPVIMWGTVGMTSGYTIHNWITSEGTSVSYNSKLHCLLLVGYDENNYFFNDPLAKKTKGYSKARVEAAYAALGKQAIVIKKESSASGGPTVGPLPDQRHEYPIKYPKYLPLPDEHSSSYTYNSAGQMISSVDKAGNVSYTTYDGMGNITSMTDPGGSAKTYSYDTAGRMLERKATGDKSEKCTYNAAGLLSYKHDAKYKHHYYTYDAAGRILSESIDTNPYGKTEIISYTYDANGNVLTVSDTSGTVTREYDALNRVSKYTDKFGNTVEYLRHF